MLTGSVYETTDYPDERNTVERDVDFILTPKDAELPMLAIEHTIVESFEGQIRYVNKSWDLVQEVNSKCRGALPIDRYFILVVPNTLVDSLEKTAKAEFIENVSRWIVNEAERMKHDHYISWQYGEHNLLLMCGGGSHPDINGSVGRIPGQPTQLTELKEERLWISFCHGLGKFPKYKNGGYKTVLLLEDISGTYGGPDFSDDVVGKSRRNLVDALVDYVVVFVSHQNRMIVGNIWKDKQRWYEKIPYSMRFYEENGKWKCQG